MDESSPAGGSRIFARLHLLAPHLERLGFWRAVFLVTAGGVAVSVLLTRLLFALVGAGSLNGIGLAASVVCPLVLGSSTSIVFFGMLFEISRLSREVHELALRDPLTGLMNRRAFHASMERLLPLLSRREDPVSLLFVDIDHFKAINDGHGHEGGDHALKACAATLAADLREGDLLARFGGEEFVAALPGTGPDEAEAIAERLRAAVAASPALYRGVPIPMTVSIGLHGEAGLLPEALEAALHRADAALYRAKVGGRNRVRRSDAPGADA